MTDQNSNIKQEKTELDFTTKNPINHTQSIKLSCKKLFSII